MNTDATVDRRARLLAFPPLLRAGYRPFFLLGPLWAIIVVGLWIPALEGTITLPSAFNPLSWHRHEMLFGFVGAAIAGFLLTAVPNWTGRLPIAGWRLAMLASLWLSARLAILFSASTGAIAALALEGAFLLTLAGACAREVFISRNRNVPVVGVLILFAIAALVDHLESLGFVADRQFGWRGGFALILILVTLIGGRIVPSFTANWLTKQGRSRVSGQASAFDYGVVAVTALGLLCWAFRIHASLTAALLFAGGLLQLARLARWQGYRTTAEPLVLILHVAYAWLPVGMILLGLGIVDIGVSATAGLHALGAGAMASMVLAVMTRATLGHTGRDLHAGKGTFAIYVLITLAAVLRVAAPWAPADYLLLVKAAGMLWSAAFLLFLALYAPKLLGPRPDGRP